MSTSISIETKKEFIRWFLRDYQLKRRESVWILNYILGHEELLENVRFVDEAHYCPRAMIMSTGDSIGIPFRFYKGYRMTADAEESFKYMKDNPHEELYIQLNYPEKSRCPNYALVQEENPFVPDLVRLGSKDEKIAEELLEHSLKAYRKEELLKQIDEALDNKDKEWFIELTEELSELVNG